MSTTATDLNTTDINRKHIVDRIQKKIKHSNLKPEEIQAIDKARSQVYNQTSTGGFIGAVGSFFFGRKRKFSTIFMIPFTLGGFFLGSQLGMMTGIYSGMSTINKLPDQARLVNLVKDIQTEVMNAGGYTKDNETSRPRPMTPEEKFQYQQKLLKEESDILSSNDDQVQQNDDPWWISSNDTPTPLSPSSNDNEILWKDDGDAYSNNDSFTSNDNSGNSSSNSSNSAWDRIRQENNQ